MADFPPTLLLVMALLAALYATVGHGGASGYLAAMALWGMAPEVMRPTALVMNCFVASWVLLRLLPAGHFNRRLFIPLISTSLPMAWLGGSIILQDAWYQSLIGLLLLYAGWRMLRQPTARKSVVFSVPLTLLMGAVLGLLSGLTGVGGGIFLSPLLFFLGWVNIRGNAAIVAAFILLNSLAALIGLAAQGHFAPEHWYAPVLAATLGALLGAELLSQRLRTATLIKLLAWVLILAGGKMLW